MRETAKRVGIWGLTMGMMATALPTLAQWELDDAKSSVDFITVKNLAVAESHSFDSLMGFIGQDGNATVTINLDSVNTLIEIRDERMRELLFETAEFPTTTISALIEPDILTAAADGRAMSRDVTFAVSMHGLEKKYTAPVVVFGDEASLRVVTAKPIVVSAADFGLAGGVEALRAVAGLTNISTAVPVSFNLLFEYAR
ncbi:hypothetical protein BST95_02345 [Halioglobus japonicus]|uniref:YceI family protein n=1 Tax=Halioglobus japonicus TaxID=930805 RepID=A0AAP8MCQ2_9GAMM|nr:YceI family protein [Halioglobus japonicus]AQA17232.1 hypothetical protein BST95_02345 [Halioglobus japonicus]PLW85147.1 YceI family protein [Halioglobus japonicus]GHD19695.1 hypothetical protein GCM10007052_28500 [Halioglobus japonicus]